MSMFFTTKSGFMYENTDLIFFFFFNANTGFKFTFYILKQKIFLNYNIKYLCHFLKNKILGLVVHIYIKTRKNNSKQKQ